MSHEFRSFLCVLEDRLAPAGDLDLLFGVNGKIELPHLEYVTAMSVLPDQRILVTGPVQMNGDDDFGVIRLTADGKLDSTFGNEGFVRIPFNLVENATGDDVPYALAAKPDGGAYIVGTAVASKSPNYFTGVAIASLTPTGELDATFGIAGKLSFPWAEAFRSEGTDVRLMPGGNIVIAGTGVHVFELKEIVGSTRLLPNGEFDASYGNGGFAYQQYGRYSVAARIDPLGGVIGLHRREDGKSNIQSSSYMQNDTYLLARTAPNGQVDVGYGIGGTAEVSRVKYMIMQNTSMRLNQYPLANLSVTQDGHAWVNVGLAGIQSGIYYSELVRRDLQGQPVASFGDNGTRIDIPFSTSVYGLLDGRMLMVVPNLNSFNEIRQIDPGVYRLLSDGSPDTLFGTDGFVSRDALGYLTRQFAGTSDGGMIAIGRANDQTTGERYAFRLLGDPPLPPAIQALSPYTAVGSGTGGGQLKVILPTGFESLEETPFGPEYTAGIRTAVADFNGDGVDDVMLGTGPGVPTRVVIQDGATMQTLWDYAPFEESFTGGVYVTQGDINKDGTPDIVITPDEGGGPRVRVFDGATKGLLADFFGIEDPDFRGGARAAIGDMNGDEYGDVIVAAGFLGGPRVAGFDGKSLGSGTRVFADFFAFESTLRNGVFPSVGDIDGNGKADLIVGAGPGGGPRVTVFEGQALQSNQYTSLANFFAGDPANRGGVRLAVKNLDADARADLVAGAGMHAASRVTAYLGKSLVGSGNPVPSYDVDAFPGLTSGVFVG